MSQTLCKHTQLAYIDRVWEPRYSTKDFLVATKPIKRLKVQDLKVVFPSVSETNEWHGEWYISKKEVLKSKHQLNNGLDCLVVSLDKLKPLKLEENCEHMYK